MLKKSLVIPTYSFFNVEILFFDLVKWLAVSNRVRAGEKAGIHGKRNQNAGIGVLPCEIND